MRGNKTPIVNNVLQEEAPAYCILHGWHGLPEHLPSDLDIVVAPKDLPALERALLDADGARVVNLLQHEATCYYFVLALSEEERVRFLPVDAAADFRRDGRVWFGAEELLRGRRRWKEFWVAAPEVEFKYLLLKKILKQGLPEGAGKRLQELAGELGPRAEMEARGLLGQVWGGRVLGWLRAGDWQSLGVHLATLKKVLKRQRVRQDPLNPLRYWLPEIPRIWRRWRYPTGLWIVVLGPDGSGKSTLIEYLHQDLTGAFRRTVRFHLMPSLFRKRSGSGPVTDPHGKPPRSRVASLLKLGYYLLDYTLGYWLKVRPALTKSTLGLFDRYYDDLLVDPKRYRYGGPIRLARWLRRFIPRPDLWLILDVPEEELLRRKQEVPLEELRRQRTAYRRLAAELKNAVLLDGSPPPEEVARQAGEVILEYLHERYLSRRGLWFPASSFEGDSGYLNTALGAEPSEKGRLFLHLAFPDGRGYLLPSNSRKATISGLSLYAPQKPKAKLLKQVLRAGLMTGLARYWLPKVNLDLRALEGHLAEVFGLRDLSLAVSLGTPGPHRKPVVQVMTREGGVLGYVKVGWNEATRRLVENEALMLQRLQEKNLPFLVPRVLFAGEWKGRFHCVQSPPAQEPAAAPPEWGPLYVEALMGMAFFGLKRQRLKESAFWKRLRDRAAWMENGYWRHAVERSMERVLNRWEDRELPFHPAHGDFAPWNAFSVAEGLYLYDWEYAFEAAPAGYDLFHFAVQRAWLVEGRAPGGILDAVKEHFSRARAYWQAIGMDESTWGALFELYLLDRLVSANFEQIGAQMKRNLVVLLDLWVSREWE